jgi:hypothetical protein
MKFANKYELFEAVTTGRVETFFAKDLASGERVLLHIFEAPEKKNDQPTVQWVLESFSKIAPDPAALVIETGRYSGTTYAYLVTKLPDNAALQRWIQSYEAFAVKTQKVATRSEPAAPATPVASTKSTDRLPDQPTPLRSPNPPGEITLAFSPGPSPANPRSETSTLKQADQKEIFLAAKPNAPPREPAGFISEFFSGSPKLPETLATKSPAKSSAAPTGDVAQINTKAQETAKVERSEPQKSAPAQDSGGFTALFRSDFKQETNAPAENLGATRKPEDAKAGDFTDFFRGPFDGERPAETPDILPKAPEMPQRNAPGEFTMLFGSGKANPFAPSSPSEDPIEDALRRDKPAAFTQLFPDASHAPAPLPTNASLPTSEPVTPKKSEKPSPPQEPTWTPPPSKVQVPSFNESIVAKPIVTSPVQASEPPVPRGATNVFAVPDELSSPPRTSSGPGEYTRIISGGMGSLAPPPPPPPKIAAPPPPKFSPPAPPAIKAPTAAKPKPSYLPLIIIMNVLLFVAILLIIYFAVKH